MIPDPYPEEAPRSIVSRWVAWGRLSPEILAEARADDLSVSSGLLRSLIRAGATEPMLQATRASGLLRHWPAINRDDLHQPAGGNDRLGKACELCLAEDAAAGRDHYLRQEWCIAWRVSCRRHGVALVDVESAELVPVIIDGVRAYRVRLLRELDQTCDRYMRQRSRGGGSRSQLPTLVLCLETDICASLQGRPLPDLWCTGRSWGAARPVVSHIADLLLTSCRGSRDRLIHLIAEDDWMPQTQTLQFAKNTFVHLGAFWQRRLLENCARLLVDPARYEHLQQGQRLNIHAELAYGRNGQARARRSLGRMATSDLFSLVLAYADDVPLQSLERRVAAWPRPIAARLRQAASVAIYIP